MRISLRAAVCFLVACAIFCVTAHGQAPAPVDSPAPSQPAEPQTLSKQVATDCWNKRRLAIRAVNLKYIALTQTAADAFTKENNAQRTTDANTWIKNLAWANDANLKGVAPDTKDRLGELQAAYLKERVEAIVSADGECIDMVETAMKKASQSGDQESLLDLGKQEERIRQELRSVARADVASPKLSVVEKATAECNNGRNAAVKTVNEKYAALSLTAMLDFTKANDQANADAAREWARRLNWTDDHGNLDSLSPGAKNRLGE
ncbi:MAG TPA: hypothetical protein VG733_10525, partial [Chthoniobacteraceae bacterium]|nr:hypothetical protein [Chthoniobacteraceae bacterium]